MKQNITIIGAGLAGCFLAILFARKGYNVSVFEQLPESLMTTDSSKKSFSLAMYGYGIDVFSRVGLWQTLSHLFLRLEGSVTQIGHRKETHPIIARMDKAPFYTIARTALLRGLLHEAKKYSNITFYFGKHLVAIKDTTKTIHVEDIKTKQVSTISCDVVFGADGVNSIISDFIQKKEPTVVEKKYTGWSYKQVFFSKDLAKKSGLHGNFSQNWTRKNAIFVAYPNHDGSFHGMFILPKKAKTSFTSLITREEIQSFIFTYFPDFKPALAQITQAFLTNQEGYFVTVNNFHWYHKKFVALIGDAAHGFPPFYGQGVSAAIADCMEIVQLVELYGTDWEIIFPLYQRNRKKNTDALAQLSNQTLQQYRRDKKADYLAVYAKIESFLSSFLPKFFTPPPFMLVAEDQTRAAEYVLRHSIQRKREKYLGVPLLVGMITGVIALYETCTKMYRLLKTFNNLNTFTTFNTLRKSS